MNILLYMNINLKLCHGAKGKQLEIRNFGYLFSVGQRLCSKSFNSIISNDRF